MFPSPLSNRCGGSEVNSVFPDLFEKIFQIVIRRSVTEQHARLQFEYCG
jgi:hypothetical protein